MSKIKVRVTQEDIDDGEPKHTKACPIASRLRAMDYVCEVYPSFITISSKGSILQSHIDLPRSAQRFIKRFDNKLEVKPFNFYLDVPE